MRDVRRPGESFVLLSADETRVADEDAVARGDSWDGLLARAGAALGRGVAEVCRARRGGLYGRRVVVVAGKGDNGGDGWVAAAWLRERGVAVTVVAPHGLDAATSPHTASARAAWLASGGRATSGLDVLRLTSRWWEDHPVVVDCLLGTGARGAPRGVVADAVEAIRWCGAGPSVPVVACDVPSGVDADTGAVAGDAVHADVTVTFGAAKRGLVLDPGRGHVGRLVVTDLGPRWRVPRSTPRAASWYATGDEVAAPRPWAAEADKLARGRVLVVAGSQRYAGAGALAAAAAVRAGAGLVSLATSGPSEAARALEPGVMVRVLPAAVDDVGGPDHRGVAEVAEGRGDADVVVVGPGLGHGLGTRAVVEAALGLDGASAGGASASVAGAGAPSALPAHRPVVVLDADGCNVFRDDAAALAAVPGPLVLTPHERELARLLGVPVDEVRADRVAAARSLADLTGAVVLAKGAPTVVLGPGLETAVVTSGGPALGSGGTGDVLAGMLGANLAAAVATDGPLLPGEVAVAVVATAHLHGLLGERAGAAGAGRATARDLLTQLPATLAWLAARAEQEGWQP